MLFERWRRVSCSPLVVMLAIGFAYFAASRFTLPVVSGRETLRLAWAAAGIAVATVLVLGLRVLPGLWLAYFAVNLLLVVNSCRWTSISASIVISSSMATGFAVGGALGAALVRQFAGQGFLRKGMGMVRFLVLAGPLSCAVAAIIGSAMLCAGNVAAWNQFPLVALKWWIGSTVSVVAVAPLLLTWCEYTRASSRASRWMEITALSSSAGACVIASFVLLPSQLAWHFAPAILLVPGLAWASARFGLRGATTTLAAVIAVAMYALMPYTHPILSKGGFETALLLQLSLILAAATTLILTAIAAERQTEIRALRSIKQALEIRMRARNADLETTQRKLREEIADRAAADKARAFSERIDLAILSNYTTQMMALNSMEAVPNRAARCAAHLGQEPQS